jgi:hypothetical protein
LLLRKILFPVGFLGAEGAFVSEASIAVDQQLMRHTVADRSSNEADFLCYLYLACRLWKRVVSLAVTGKTISGQDFRRERVQVFWMLRLPLIGCRWDIRLLIGRRTKPTSCVFPVFSVAVMEKCCDACVEYLYNFWSGCLASGDACFSGASIAVDGKSMGHTVADESSNEADFLCISCI